MSEMTFTRRALLGSLTAAGGAALLGTHAFSAPAMPGWQLGYANAPAAGFDAAPMRLIQGRLPDGLAGALYRNGPGWFRYGEETTGHWFDGDGMVQKIALGDGRAVQSGRFVQTRKHRQEQAAGRFLAPGFGTQGDPDWPIMGPDDVNAANTSVLMLGGDLYALWEAGSPVELDPETLDTRGPKTWRSDLKGMPFLAHPKCEPDGTVWNLAVSGPRVGVYRIDAAGRLAGFDMLDIGVAAYIHDWAMTARHLVILIQPWVQTRQVPPFVDSLEWRPQDGLRLLIVDKDDLSRQRWAEVPARAFFHTGAAWEDASGTLHVDGCFYSEPVLAAGGATNLMEGHYDASVDNPVGYLGQIIIPPDGPARLEDTGIDGEFPTINPRRHGLPRRLTAMVGGSAPDRPGGRRLSVFDWQSGRHQAFDFGAHRMAEEHLFVAKPGRQGEAAAWLVGTALNTRTRASEVHVFDVADIGAGPVASFTADYAWPLGFHGTFAPG